MTTTTPKSSKSTRPSLSDVLVLGGTGKTGRRVVRKLRDTGTARVRAASRSGEVTFDWTVPATWEPALSGASAVYLVSPEDPALVGEFVATAVRAGVRRFVALSGHGTDTAVAAGTAGEGFGRGMLAGEEAVRGSGAEWTIIRPSNFFQNFDEDLWLAPLKAGRLALPIGAMPEPFVDAEDVAEVAAAVLIGEGHAGRTYELTGPRALTFAEATETIARAAGRPIRYEELTPAAYRTELLGQGWPEAMADLLGGMFAVHRAGHTTALGDGVQQVLDREPADLAVWAREVAAKGTWA